MIDLSANECPYPPSSNVLKAITESLGMLNRYAAPDQRRTLIDLLAKFADVHAPSIVIGHGTDALIAPILTHFSKDRAVAVTSPTSFGNLELIKQAGGTLKRIQLIPPDFQVNWNCLTGGPYLVLLSQPNTPTGQCLISRQQLIEILERDETLVVIDEAGFDYCQETVIDLVEAYPNLAVTRTMDKTFGLAGLRISWMSAGEILLKAFQYQTPSIGRVACAAAVAALEDPAYAKANAALTISERSRMTKSLQDLGFQVFESKANFLLIKTEVPDLALRLRQLDILIEDLSGNWLESYYRISIGSEEEIDALIEAISKL